MFSQHFSILSIIVLLVITAVIVVLFSLFKSYLPLFFNRSQKKFFRVRSWLYLSEIITVVAVLTIFISYSISKNLILASILTVVLLVVLYYFSIFFVRDYLAGLLIKISGEYRVGDQLSFDGVSGRITKLGKIQLRLKDTNGDNIYLPYHILSDKLKTLQQQKEKMHGYSFNYSLPKNISYYKDSEALQQYIQALPWIHPSYAPEIKLEKTEADRYELFITIYAFDKKYYKKIEASIRQKYEH